MWLSLAAGFLAGILCLALIELIFIAHFLKHLSRSHRRSPIAVSSENVSAACQSPRIFLKGDIWLAALPSSLSKKDNIKISADKEKSSKDYRRKKENGNDCIEIYASRRHAQLQDNVLKLQAEDGSEEHIAMKGCKILSVSGGEEISRKWAKRYPIQLEGTDQEFSAKGSVYLLYFETSWEKETWCQVLRAAVDWTDDKEIWYIARKREFHDYCSMLYQAYPMFSKMSGRHNKYAKDERSQNTTENSTTSVSRRQKIWKKFMKISSKANLYKEGSGSGQSMTANFGSECHESSKQKPSEFQTVKRSLSDQNLCNSSLKSDFERISTEDSHSLSDSARSTDYDFPSDLVVGASDQSTMCWNMILSRLFFDACHNKNFQEACLKRIQKQFTHIITPAYMGKLTCTKFELGSLPPVVNNMQTLPSDPNYVWSFDVDIEYAGGALVKIDTCLDVRDSGSTENLNLGASLVGAAAADILKAGLESFEAKDDSNLAHSSNMEAGEVRSDKVQPSRGLWRTFLSHVADHVSSVPITLSMKLISLKGTLRVRIKSPPTDRIWFGFTSMPTIELRPEPYIGERRITTGPVLTVINNKIKMLIQHNLVLPNCEGIWVPWMVSENNDWIPRTCMPVPWSPLELLDPSAREEGQKQYNDSTQSFARRHAVSSSSGDTSAVEVSQSHELRRPLLDDYSLNCKSEAEKGKATTGSTDLTRDPRMWNMVGKDSVDINNSSDKDVVEDGSNQFSRRTKFLNMGKKMTEKLDEKRRRVVGKVREEYESMRKA
ncbi:hypothetical protein KP509_27G044100 [Ceratopteris richardii]|uniref:SMP-LTD domain-containing protein n=2 Tax=Ceratopteris richardii TaxID=49495 RepID=A0A8T2RIH6_CERRI|nr:hypothetical protein KP509_27G044100 [Ceratopteris richardii]KAH7295379.1 hypothetical protein KP509_27G044100 [Ceratopteris richardii]KAH7295380.1 hypothetical protein KP509_27G044100 [Ceratopteris richardii]KAH7295382.1 hypothetical protein KP509_27G044100 [Ceratopteris richardii]